MRRILVFDCDGTLVDSAAIIVASMEEAFASTGLEAPLDHAIRSIIGLSLADAVGRLTPSSTPQVQRQVVAAYRDAFLKLRASERFDEPLFPGIGALLEELERRGRVLAVATGKSRRGLDHLISVHGLDGRFASIQTADTNPSKPHPEMLWRAVDEAGGKPDEAVMIGDTTYDMEMAVAAGVAAVGVAWGHHPPGALRAAGAGEVADDTPALRALLLR